MVARRPAEAFPPGDFLQEELEERMWTPADLAMLLKCPVRVVDEIVAGKRGIVPEIARGLAEAFGSSPDYWLELEASYQTWREDNSERKLSKAIG